jgi:hypothetical protein
MTTRRRLLVFGLLATLTGLGVGWWLMMWPRTAITRENAERVQLGMTLEEVQQILGRLTDWDCDDTVALRDETSGPCDQVYGFSDSDGKPLAFESEIWGNQIDPRFRCIWLSDERIVIVYLDQAGQVAGRRSSPMKRLPELPLDMIRRWLHL